MDEMTTHPIAPALVELTKRFERGEIKPRQYDMVMRELMRTVVSMQRHAEPEPASDTDLTEPEPEPEPEFELQRSVRFPHVEVQLSDQDGNAFFIVGRVRSALRRGGATREQLAEFEHEALLGDYDNVLQTVMRWVNVA